MQNFDPLDPVISRENIIAIRGVEFSNGGYKIRKILPNNQHTQSRLLNSENWISGGLRSFQKSVFYAYLLKAARGAKKFVGKGAKYDTFGIPDCTDS